LFTSCDNSKFQNNNYLSLKLTAVSTIFSKIQNGVLVRPYVYPIMNIVPCILN
jgi:hypothetical protein